MDGKKPLVAMNTEFDNLLHPSQVFDRPRDVVNDLDLSLNEKRAILASWASDACAVEAAPALRKAPSGRTVVQFDEIMDALRSLDQQMEPLCIARTKSLSASGRPHAYPHRRGGRSEGEGSPLH
jgi:hypothetical protein